MYIDTYEAGRDVSSSKLFYQVDAPDPRKNIL